MLVTSALTPEPLQGMSQNAPPTAAKDAIERKKTPMTLPIEEATHRSELKQTLPHHRLPRCPFALGSGWMGRGDPLRHPNDL